MGQDGVQYPPICFPKGSHLLQFLTCLEAGLLPNGSLDPPLWNEEGKGKVLPKLKSKTGDKSKTDVNANELQQDDYEPREFVFRIINSNTEICNNSNSSANSSPHNIFRNFFNSTNPLSSILSSFSTPASALSTISINTGVSNNPSGEILLNKPLNSSTSSTESYSMCPSTPPVSLKSNSSISSIQTSAIIGSKELTQHVTPLSILANNRAKLCRSVSVR